MAATPAARNFPFSTDKQRAAFKIIFAREVAKRFIHIYIWVELLQPFGRDAAVHPVQIKVAATFLFEFEFDRTGNRSAFRIYTFLKNTAVHGTRAARNFSRVTQLEQFKRRAHNMTAHIAQGAGSELPPATPVKRNKVINIIGLPRRAQPQVPFKLFRYCGPRCRPRNALGPYRPVGPAINFLNIANQPGLEPLPHGTHTIARSTLIAHLGYHLSLIHISEPTRQA